ncbi:UDPglucose--hexose-1-phosphate uridylyltransferase [Anaerosolibacter carboniphilus]|uniref:Galactose-1-phosphate uridylyltransferase n=1 Tax=Anaerosolibacter carboniphilus TaxID=1417629 RepID=A0A841KT92_9FIRM|nr:UDP-glucose--hexose-1-phosphate uridylyltransferase [Anaerosolibacter carboniphilus]MBB6215250.1 UDPglucose--hexose-1-phosphate uridylyltransferase [Anaerosolibacter carboniphilus]
MIEIYKEIQRLIHYGLDKNLICKEDEIYVRNRILEVLKIDEYEEIAIEKENLAHPQGILDRILDYAHEKGILEENTVTYRDLLDTRIMDCFMPRPSDLRKCFDADYRISPQMATENYYKLSMASNYIRTERTSKNVSWRTQTDFGELEITINLSKPEKDPKAIAAAKNMRATSYPKCLLCKENEGYAGRVNHPARQNHRIIPVKLGDEDWFLQFSPYVYYHEHAIIFKDRHEPMKITKDTFARLLAFVDQFPHYFIGSNADLPIVGGSILSHDHFQGGNYSFAMEKAPILKAVEVKGFEDVEVGMVKWPLSVIRLRSDRRERLVELASMILDKWKGYSDERVEILSATKDEPHNTITPIARYKNGKFELDLVLRNNRTSDEHPMGIFHPHQDVHHIKKENIGLIEVMGLAVLPDRLIHELDLLKDCLLGWKDIDEYEELDKHKDWFHRLKQQYQGIHINFDEVLRREVGKTFERILMDAGVFKQDQKGLAAFEDFMKFLSR